MDAIASIQYKAENFLVKDKGRTAREISFAMVSNGIYRGYGYLKKNKKEYMAADYLNALVLQKDNNDIKRILNAYLKNHEENMVLIPELSTLEFDLSSLSIDN
jgi:DNA polymerase-3 subunit epsilon